MPTVRLTASISQLSVNNAVCASFNKAISENFKLSDAALNRLNSSIRSSIEKYFSTWTPKLTVQLDYKLTPRFEQLLKGTTMRVGVDTGGAVPSSRGSGTPVPMPSPAHSTSSVSGGSGTDAALRAQMEAANILKGQVSGLAHELKVLYNFQNFRTAQAPGKVANENVAVSTELLRVLQTLKSNMNYSSSTLVGATGGEGREGKNGPVIKSLQSNPKTISEINSLTGGKFQQFVDAISGFDASTVTALKEGTTLKKLLVSLGSGTALTTGSSFGKGTEAMQPFRADNETITKPSFEFVKFAQAAKQLEQFGDKVGLIGGSFTFAAAKDQEKLLSQMSNFKNMTGEAYPKSQVELSNIIKKLDSSNSVALSKTVRDMYSVRPNGMSGWNDKGIAAISSVFENFGAQGMLDITPTPQMKGHVSQKNNLGLAIQQQDTAYASMSGIESSLKSRVLEASKGLPEINKEIQGILKGQQTMDNLMSMYGKHVQQSKSFMQEISEQIGVASKRLLAWSVVSTGLFTALAGVGKLFSGAFSFERQLTESTRVLNANKVQVSQLSSAIKSSAMAYGFDLTEAAKASAVFAQQGLGMAAVMKMTDASLKLSKTSGMSTADSTEILTAIQQQFNLSAEEGVDIVDKLVKVSDKYAVTQNDLAQAIFRTGSTAQETGTNLEQLMGMVTAMQEKTRRGGGVIGTSLTTIQTRLYADAFKKQVKPLGIDVTSDGFGSLKSGYAILGELAQKWNGLSDAEKHNIALAAAGQRQYSQFLALMNGFDTAMSATNMAMDAQGASTKALGSIFETTEEKMKRLWASMEVGATNVLLPMVTPLTSLVTLFTKLSSLTLPALGAGAFMGYKAYSKNKGISQYVGDNFGSIIKEEGMGASFFGMQNPQSLKVAYKEKLKSAEQFFTDLNTVQQKIASGQKISLAEWGNYKGIHENTTPDQALLLRKAQIAAVEGGKPMTADQLYRSIGGVNFGSATSHVQPQLDDLRRQNLVENWMRKLTPQVDKLVSNFTNKTWRPSVADVTSVMGNSVSEDQAKEIAYNLKGLHKNRDKYTPSQYRQEAYNAINIGGIAETNAQTTVEKIAARRARQEIEAALNKPQSGGGLSRMYSKAMDYIMPVRVSQEMTKTATAKGAPYEGNPELFQKDYKGMARGALLKQTAGRALEGYFLGSLAGSAAENLIDSQFVNGDMQRAQAGNVGAATSAAKAKTASHAVNAGLTWGITAGAVTRNPLIGAGVGLTVGLGDAMMNYTKNINDAAKVELENLSNAQKSIEDFLDQASHIFLSGKGFTEAGSQQLEKISKQIAKEYEKIGISPENILAKMMSGQSVKDIKKDLDEKVSTRKLNYASNLSGEDFAEQIPQILLQSTKNKNWTNMQSSQMMIQNALEDPDYKFKNQLLGNLQEGYGSQLLLNNHAFKESSMTKSLQGLKLSGLDPLAELNKRNGNNIVEDLGSALKDGRAVGLDKATGNFVTILKNIDKQTGQAVFSIVDADGKLQKFEGTEKELTQKYSAIKDSAIANATILAATAEAMSRWQTGMDDIKETLLPFSKRTEDLMGSLASGPMGQKLAANISAKNAGNIIKKSYGDYGTNNSYDTLMKGYELENNYQAFINGKNGALDPKLVEKYRKAADNNFAGVSNAEMPLAQAVAARAGSKAMGLQDFDEGSLGTMLNDISERNKVNQEEYKKIAAANKVYLSDLSQYIGASTQGIESSVQIIIKQMTEATDITSLENSFSAGLDAYQKQWSLFFEHNAQRTKILGDMMQNQTTGQGIEDIQFGPDVYGQQAAALTGKQLGTTQAFSKTQLANIDEGLGFAQQRYNQATANVGSAQTIDEKNYATQMQNQSMDEINKLTLEKIGILSQERDSIVKTVQAHKSLADSYENERQAMGNKMLGVLGMEPGIERQATLATTEALGGIKNQKDMDRFMKGVQDHGGYLGFQQIQKGMGNLSEEDQKRLMPMMTNSLQNMGIPGYSYMGNTMKNFDERSKNEQGLMNSGKGDAQKLTNQIDGLYGTVLKNFNVHKTVLEELGPVLDASIKRFQKISDILKTTIEGNADKIANSLEVKGKITLEGNVTMELQSQSRQWISTYILDPVKKTIIDTIHGNGEAAKSKGNQDTRKTPSPRPNGSNGEFGGGGSGGTWA